MPPSPSPPPGSGTLEALLARTAPAVLELLGDGVPRSKAAIITALGDRHARAT